MNNNSFIHEDFLLETPASRELYHRYAADLSIIDCHCHLPPKEIADDIRWGTIGTLWLGGDHYKCEPCVRRGSTSGFAQETRLTRQIESLSQLGLLSQFVGMLTDSRSFLSYTRHEYFRRLLCNILGSDMERGLLPNDSPLVGQLVADVSYHNARRYFGFYPDL